MDAQSRFERHPRPGGAVVVAALASGLLVCLSACGARSALPACTQPGATRACENGCGTGAETCLDGQWGRCEVASMTRACSNACGQGLQSCVDGDWSPCAVPVSMRGCSNGCGPGEESCVDGGWLECDAARPGPPTLVATVRDFRSTHPDFEPDSGIGGLAPGIVAPALDPNDKPVYVGAEDGGFLGATHGATYFDEWYRDVPPVNLRASPLPLALSPAAGNPTIYGYDNDAFFPIDNQLFGNEGRPHNYDFTLELVASFRYTGGETFRFASDDDSFVFLNRKLAVDLGGIHQSRVASVNLDLQSQDLGIVKGLVYPMHLFYAERHVLNAALHIDVAAADFAVCADGSMP